MSERTNETSGDMPIGEIPIDVFDTEADSEGVTSVAAGIREFEIQLGDGGGELDIDVLQGGGAEVEEDGTIIADEVTVITDENSGATIIDEMVAIVRPDGTEIYDQTISTIDADGTYTVLGEEVSVVEGGSV
jgi:hypothetical protein